MLYIYFYLYTALSSIILISCLLLSKVLNEICSLFMPFYVERDRKKCSESVHCVGCAKMMTQSMVLQFSFLYLEFPIFSLIFKCLRKKKKKILHVVVPHFYFGIVQILLRHLLSMTIIYCFDHPSLKLKWALIHCYKNIEEFSEERLILPSLYNC